MSDADFRTFYWPTLKAVMKGLVEQGIVPALFAEGGYNKRLEVIADDELPAGSVLWMFDQTDMAAAKRALGGYACIAGNVPTALLALGTADEVEHYVTDLLDECAADGGFFLRNGAVARRRQGREPQGHDRDRARLAGLGRADGRRVRQASSPRPCREHGSSRWQRGVTRVQPKSGMLTFAQPWDSVRRLRIRTRVRCTVLRSPRREE